MNEQEQEHFEAELRRARPTPLPNDFMARLQAAKPAPEPIGQTVATARRAVRGRLGEATLPKADLRPRQTQNQPSVERPVWETLWRWLVPTLALASIVLLVVKLRSHSDASADKKPLDNVAYGIKADEVQVDQELVSSYDVVAKLPTGEPVRFRCRRWKDQLVVTDKSTGMSIEQNNPRVEVVPVRFETY